MKILVTGGTVFVSRYTAEYFVKKGYEVYVLNRNTRPQSEGVSLINCDRHSLGDKLKNIYFDSVIKDYLQYVNSPHLRSLHSLRGRGFVRRLVFKFPPEKSGNPYSNRRVHFTTTG